MACVHGNRVYKCPECAAVAKGKLAATRDTDERLVERCSAMLSMLQMDAMLRQGDPVADLMAFVMAEKGRAADPALADTLPLVLYFGTKEDRDAFVAAVREAKPGMYSKHLP